jgi:hypothetical protein
MQDEEVQADKVSMVKGDFSLHSSRRLEHGGLHG